MTTADIALAALKDLHRPFDRRTSIYPIPNDPHTIVCNHCLGPIDWPCATARLIYQEDELQSHADLLDGDQ